MALKKRWGYTCFILLTVLNKDRGKKSNGNKLTGGQINWRTAISDAWHGCAAGGMHNAHEHWKNAHFRTVIISHSPFNTTGFSCKNQFKAYCFMKSSWSSATKQRQEMSLFQWFVIFYFAIRKLCVAMLLANTLKSVVYEVKPLKQVLAQFWHMPSCTFSNNPRQFQSWHGPRIPPSLHRAILSGL